MRTVDHDVADDSRYTHHLVRIDKVGMFDVVLKGQFGLILESKKLDF